ncbi:hypothetical protein ONZ45_g10918 [Pleurotus djamor]|nr:hypothetical protein ONZ45_g10918 [Pleurotus djamor]
MRLPFAVAISLAVSVALVRAVPVSSNREYHEKVAQGLRLIELGEDIEPTWKTDAEVEALISSDVRFIDVTDTFVLDQLLSKYPVRVAPVQYNDPSNQAAVNAVTSSISVSNMQQNLATLSNFHTRYYRSATGGDASKWILSTVQGIASGHDHITASAFNHGWPQTSTIVRIAGKDDSGPVTILGAHMDSVNQRSASSGRSPGADDDGSGSVNLIEAFRALVESGFEPATPVEFHWYAGEEGGLLGSRAIASKYKADGVAVKGYMNLDMTAYFRPGDNEVVAMISDNTSADLNTYIGKLVTTYTRLTTVTSRCGYGCSDHASWTRYGYPASMPFEAPIGRDNPNIHTDKDTTTAPGFSWDHSLEFTKLAVSFAYELSA